jgi:hypothetical protein
MSDPDSVQITLPRWAGVAIALFAADAEPRVTQIVLLETSARRSARSGRS